MGAANSIRVIRIKQSLTVELREPNLRIKNAAICDLEHQVAIGPWCQARTSRQRPARVGERERERKHRSGTQWNGIRTVIDVGLQ